MGLQQKQEGGRAAVGDKRTPTETGSNLPLGDSSVSAGRRRAAELDKA